MNLEISKPKTVSDTVGQSTDRDEQDETYGIVATDARSSGIR